MSKIRYPWWGYAKNCWKRYKEAQKEPGKLRAKEMQAVEATLMDIDKLADARERRIIVNQVLIDGYMTLEGAAMMAHVSYSTARRYQQHAIKQVGYHLDLMD